MSANIPLSQSQDGTRVQKLNQLSLSWPSESNLPSATQSPSDLPFLACAPHTSLSAEMLEKQGLFLFQEPLCPL